jgi:hypothetical protein
MADDRAVPIRLQIDLSPDQPGLLEGLETWLRLGLISDQQVRDLAQHQLRCELPPALDPIAAPFPTASPPAPDPVVAPARATPVTDFAPPDQSPRPNPRNRRPPRRPTHPSHPWFNRLMSELSVVWLLGLGVFLVVLSSAVLAATQWDQFGAVGQYLVLLAYTLVFWAVGLWCRRRPNLQLTGQTLQMIALLLMPLNLWALDGLGVWLGSDMLAGAIAVVLLSLATWHSLRQQGGTPLEQANALGLAYLHTGWGLAGVPLLAVYTGVVATAIATVYGQRRRPIAGVRWPTVVITTALGLLLVRGVTVVDSAQLGQLGLAFGLYGATLVWLGQRRLRPALAEALAPPAGGEATEDAAPSAQPWRWSIGVGRGLLLLGWLLAIREAIPAGIADWQAQALGVSLLGLALRIHALGRLGLRRDLLIAYGIAVQLSFVGWELLPIALRQPLLAPFDRWDTIGADWGYWPLLGVSLFPYVVALVALADRYGRRGQAKLGHFSNALALGSNLLLTLISLASIPVLVVNLIASTITALVVTLRRPPAPGRVMLTYGLGLASVLVAITHRWPQLPLAPWVGVMVGLAVVALGLSRGLGDRWGRSAWLYGVGLAALSYTLLAAHLVESDGQSGLGWVGLIIPTVLALIGRHPSSVLTTGLGLVFALGLPWTRLLGWGWATGLTGANSTVYRRPGVALATVGFALGGVYSGLADWGPGFPRHGADWGLVTVGLIALLWGLGRWVLRSPPPPGLDPAPDLPALVALYQGACDRWGHLLALGLLGWATVYLAFAYLGWASPQLRLGLGMGGLLLALGLRYWGQPRPRALYLAGWGVELLVASLGIGLGITPDPVSLAVPTLALGAIALGLATVTERSRPPLDPTLVSPLRTLTLLYAGLALALRAYTATAWTGWLMVGGALLILEGGCRRPSPLARGLALGLLSVGWYELVIFQLLRGPAGAAVDGLVVLAGVAALIMAVYRLAAGPIDRRLGLPRGELIWAAHLHWLVGSLLLLGVGIGAAGGGATLGGLGLAIATALVGYALAQGRGPDDAAQAAWVYTGLVELIGWVALGRSLFPALSIFDPWWGVVASALAVPIYWLPWAAWGWSQRPWRVMAVGVPLAIALVTGGLGHIPTLWVLAGFYGWLAWHSGKIQISYLSAVCIVWAIWVWLETQALDDGLAWVLPLGLALIYFAQVDPGLKLAERKEQRHWLRAIALALILLTALLSNRWTGLPVGALALGAIAAGLLLRVRAPLYVGTAVFGLNALNQLVLLNAAFPFLKWVVGILLGIALIWIAADVERRRDQWLQISQTWGQDLDQWQ